MYNNIKYLMISLNIIFLIKVKKYLFIKKKNIKLFHKMLKIIKDVYENDKTNHFITFYCFFKIFIPHV